MNTNTIREMIEEKISEESETDHFRNYLLNIVDQGAAISIIKFIQNYLRVTPDLMDKVYLVAQQKNFLNQFQPIFNGLFSYWIDENDFIPDNLGLIGICDDAYLSLALMHLIANTPIQGRGVLLGNINLSQINQDMRALLGSEISSKLDATVNVTYQSINIQNSISSLFDIFAGGMMVGNNFAGIQNMVDQYGIEDSVNTQLGAMGVI